jgi:hypothetical protein
MNPPLLSALIRRAILPAVLAAFSLSTARAQQQTLIDWSHEWAWMHPMGAMPPGQSGGADADFATTWYLSETAFAAQYDGPVFGSVPAVPGDPFTPASFDSGRGPGPVAYGDFQYTTTPLPAGTPAEFPGVASRLMTPNSPGRHTAYFRTTFTIPNDGKTYQNPVLRYILDDGGFVYLDGVPVLRVNMTAGVADAYTQITAGKVDTESAIRTAELFKPADGNPTGGNPLTSPAIVGNAYVLSPVTLLAPGEHTLAISVHNEGGTSSDVGLAVQLTADASDCVITATGGGISRNLEGDAENLSNDTVAFDVTVTGVGLLSPSGWVVSGPLGSSLIGQTGAYGAARHFSGVPVAEFPPPGGLVLEVQDAATAACKATVTLQSPQRIGSLSAGAVSNLLLNKVPWIPTWVIDETAGTLTLHNPGAGADRILESIPVDLSGVAGDVKFTAELTADNTSTSGFEAGDTFLAELRLSDGVNTSTVNLITALDVDGSGRMNGAATAAQDEFNSAHAVLGPYQSTFTLRTIIPDSITSATLLLYGVNDSASETFIVKNVRMEAATHSIEIAAGQPVLDHRGTTDPADDTFSVPVTITPASLPPGSLGWTSNVTPASGLYSAPNPVLFGPFPVSGGPQSITLSDNPVTTVVSNTLTVNPPAPPALTATLTAGSIVRVSNGPGLADDAVTFEATVQAARGGPGYTVDAAGIAITPPTGAYAATPVTFTLTSPPASGTVTVTFTDASYAATATLNVAVPVVSVIGATDFGGGPVELLTAPGSVPDPAWVIDSTARTLNMITGGTGDKIVESAIIDLSTLGAVSFSARFQARETSTGSNFEDTDKFKAELIIDGATVINLISQWDLGNGSFGSLGLNGPPDGYLNGYKGQGAANDAVLADYNLYFDRDEFNRLGLPGSDTIDNTFDLAYTIPAEANSVQLKIYGTGISGSEYFTVSDVLFTGATNDPDTDSDGIPDSIETAAGLDPNSNADAALDLDGDGQSNLAEYRAGTSIINASSKLQVTGLTRTGASAVLQWASVAGKTYRVQTSPDLAGPWTSLGGSYVGAPSTTPGPDFGTQSATITLPAPTAGKYFLRVVIP